jgi:hypothetical protein
MKVSTVEFNQNLRNGLEGDTWSQSDGERCRNDLLTKRYFSLFGEDRPICTENVGHFVGIKTRNARTTFDGDAITTSFYLNGVSDTDENV